MLTEFPYSKFFSVNVIDLIWKFTLLNVVFEESLDQGPKALPSILRKMLKQTLVNVLLTSHYLVPRSLVDEETTRDLGTRLDITMENVAS